MRTRGRGGGNAEHKRKGPASGDKRTRCKSSRLVANCMHTSCIALFLVAASLPLFESALLGSSTTVPTSRLLTEKCLRRAEAMSKRKAGEMRGGGDETIESVKDYYGKVLKRVAAFYRCWRTLCLALLTSSCGARRCCGGVLSYRAAVASVAACPEHVPVCPTAPRFLQRRKTSRRLLARLEAGRTRASWTSSTRSRTRSTRSSTAAALLSRWGSRAFASWTWGAARAVTAT